MFLNKKNRIITGSDHYDEQLVKNLMQHEKRNIKIKYFMPHTKGTWYVFEMIVKVNKLDNIIFNIYKYENIYSIQLFNKEPIIVKALLPMILEYEHWLINHRKERLKFVTGSMRFVLPLEVLEQLPQNEIKKRKDSFNVEEFSFSPASRYIFDVCNIFSLEEVLNLDLDTLTFKVPKDNIEEIDSKRKRMEKILCK